MGPCVVGQSILNLQQGHPSQYYYDKSGFNFKVPMEPC